jgi:hypothetical protein
LAQLRPRQLKHAVVGQRPEECQVAQQAMHCCLADALQEKRPAREVHDVDGRGCAVA